MKYLAVALMCVTFAFGCGDSDRPPTAPTPAPTPTPEPAPQPPPPAPDVSGRYFGGPLWIVQVLRMSDNFQTSFNCNGTMTITQSPGSYSFTGFMTSTGPCEPVTFDVVGTFQPGGAAT